MRFSQLPDNSKKGRAAKPSRIGQILEPFDIMDHQVTPGKGDEALLVKPV